MVYSWCKVCSAIFFTHFCLRQKLWYIDDHFFLSIWSTPLLPLKKFSGYGLAWPSFCTVFLAASQQYSAKLKNRKLQNQTTVWTHTHTHISTFRGYTGHCTSPLDIDVSRVGRNDEHRCVRWLPQRIRWTCTATGKYATGRLASRNSIHCDSLPCNNNNSAVPLGRTISKDTMLEDTVVAVDLKYGYKPECHLTQ